MEEKVKGNLGPNVNDTVIPEAASKKNKILTPEPDDRSEGIKSGPKGPGGNHDKQGLFTPDENCFTDQRLSHLNMRLPLQ